MTLHHACPVDGTPCWRDRECPHVKDGVRACEAKYARFDTPDPWRSGKQEERKG